MDGTLYSHLPPASYIRETNSVFSHIHYYLLILYFIFHLLILRLTSVHACTRALLIQRLHAMYQ